MDVRALLGIEIRLQLVPLSNHEFETAKEAEEWCIAVMLEHDYRGLGMSDAEEA